MSDTISTLSAILKQQYNIQTVETIATKDCPFLALVKKNTKWVGQDLHRVPVVLGGTGAGTSSQFADAQAGSKGSSTSIPQFLVPRVSTYQFAHISSEAMEAGVAGNGAYLEAFKISQDNAAISLAKDVSVSMYRDGTGVRGQIKAASAVNTTTLTLANPWDAYNFEQGQRLDVCATKYGTKKAYGTSTNPLTVVAADPNAGTVTLAYAANDATNGIPTIAAGDYLFLKGDVAASASAPTKITGVDGWLTTTGTFMGVDRTGNQKLMGVVYDASATGAPIVEAINQAVTRVAPYGGRPTHLFVGFSRYVDLLNSLEAKTIQRFNQKVGQVGFDGVEILSAKGSVKILPDVNCPEDRGYLLDLSTWTLVTLGDMFSIHNQDGSNIRYTPDADLLESRWTCRGNLVCNAPPKNAVIKFA